LQKKQLDRTWLCAGNISAPVQVTDLVEVSKDAVSLTVCTQKKFFGWGLQFFCEWCHKEEFLANFTWPWALTVRW